MIEELLGNGDGAVLNEGVCVGCTVILASGDCADVVGNGLDAVGSMLDEDIDSRSSAVDAEGEFFDNSVLQGQCMAIENSWK